MSFNESARILGAVFRRERVGPAHYEWRGGTGGPDGPFFDLDEVHEFLCVFASRLQSARLRGSRVGRPSEGRRDDIAYTTGMALRASGVDVTSNPNGPYAQVVRACLLDAGYFVPHDLSRLIRYGAQVSRDLPSSDFWEDLEYQVRAAITVSGEARLGPYVVTLAPGPPDSTKRRKTVLEIEP